jgi:hypothetical protein
MQIINDELKNYFSNLIKRYVKVVTLMWLFAFATAPLTRGMGDLEKYLSWIGTISLTLIVAYQWFFSTK